MREPLACKPEPRTYGRVAVTGTDEVASQRYLALAALKAPQNLPQHNLSWGRPVLPLVPKADPLFYARKPQPIGGGWPVTFNIRIDVSPDTQGVRIRALRFGPDLSKADRAGLAQRGLQAVIPTRSRHLDPRPAQGGRTRPRLAQGGLATTNTHAISWIFYAWRTPGSG